MSRPSTTDVIKQGLLGGLAWGASVGTVHLGVGVALILALTVPPMTAFTAKSILIESLLAIPFGLLAAPLLWLPRGRWFHPIALASTWIALERWVAVDPTKLQMWVAPSIAGLVVLGLATAAFQRWPRVVLAAATVLPVVLVLVPIANYRLGGYAMEPNATRGTPPARAPDVLFIVTDTVRAKSVSSLGSTRDTTRNFDRFASEGLSFSQANSAATWSLPAHGSLFTGHYPSSHEAHDETRYLDDRLPTIASTMSAKGWETLCFTANPYIADTYGLTRGFDWSDRAWMTGEGGRQFSFVYRLVDKLGFRAEDKGGHQVVANLRGWMAARPADAPPAFVFVNFLEAHFPFDQLPEEHLRAYTGEPDGVLSHASQTAFGVQFGRQLTEAERAEIHQPLLDMYEGGVRYTDQLVGEVLDLWRARGTLDDTVVVILGDHGEMMGEHGAFGHVTPMYQPDLHVPMAFRYPPRLASKTVVTTPVSTVSVFATLMDLLGTSPLEAKDADGNPVYPQGPSLIPGSSERASVVISERFEGKLLADRFAPGTANGKGPLLLPHGRYRTFVDGTFKLATYSRCETPEAPIQTYLFDLATDPNEDSDLAATHPEKVAELEALLQTHTTGLRLPPLCAPVGTQVKAKMTLEDCRALEALGYVDNCDEAVQGG